MLPYSGAVGTQGNQGLHRVTPSFPSDRERVNALVGALQLTDIEFKGTIS